jgi:hypothetical protein
MKTTTEIIDVLNHSSGTEAYHKFSAIPGFPVATDGVIALAEVAGCFWFLDLIGSYQGNNRLDPAFQVWKLSVNTTRQSGIARGYNDTELIITQDIPFTDFPLGGVKLFLIDGVILLPSEY